MKETDIGRPVVGWLRDMGWDVYQEVRQCNADIIAVMGRFVWAIECKCHLNFKVIQQAYRHSGMFQWSSVAVPEKSWKRNKTEATVLLRHHGLGCIAVGFHGRDSKIISVDEVLKARMNRVKTISCLWDWLHEKQKTYCEAGSPGGKAWSPYKDTCERLVRLVASQPGITLKDALGKIEHHYTSMASAKRSLAHWITLGKVVGVNAKIVDKKLCLFPDNK